jgi:hypothetical protein
VLGGRRGGKRGLGGKHDRDAVGDLTERRARGRDLAFDLADGGGCDMWKLRTLTDARFSNDTEA